jgi:hypothetical protein
MKNTPARRSIYQLTRLVLPTKENASGSSANLWATPNTLDHLPQRSKEATLKMQNGHRKGRTKPSNLREQVDEETMKMWPTPTANEDAAGRPNGKMQRMLGNDPNIRGKTPKEWEKGSLNPDWVEWLMGYDRGWTDLDCDNPQPHDGFIKEPEDIPRVAKGKKDRAKRLKGLGNAVLPQIPMQIALAIKKTREVELCKNVKKKDVKTKQM